MVASFSAPWPSLASSSFMFPAQRQAEELFARVCRNATTLPHRRLGLQPTAGFQDEPSVSPPWVSAERKLIRARAQQHISRKWRENGNLVSFSWDRSEKKTISQLNSCQLCCSSKSFAKVFSDEIYILLMKRDRNGQINTFGVHGDLRAGFPSSEL